MAPKETKEVFKKIPLDQIDRPDDISRMDIAPKELKELADSIQERGLKQPIEVTPRGDRFLIVFGDRRFLAHKQLGKTTIMCRIEEMADNDVLIDRALENLQRVNLTPFEEAHQYARLKEHAKLTLDQISQKVGISPGTVNRRMDILRMPDSFQQAIHAKKISVSVAEELWSCPDAAKREYFLELAIEHGITTAVARLWVQDYKKELRDPGPDNGGGGLPVMAAEEVPIFRACDTCRNPVEYKNVKDLRICPACYEAIIKALKQT